MIKYNNNNLWVIFFYLQRIFWIIFLNNGFKKMIYPERSYGDMVPEPREKYSEARYKLMERRHEAVFGAIEFEDYLTQTENPTWEEFEEEYDVSGFSSKIQEELKKVVERYIEDVEKQRAKLKEARKNILIQNEKARFNKRIRKKEGKILNKQWELEDLSEFEDQFAKKGIDYREMEEKIRDYFYGSLWREDGLPEPTVENFFEKGGQYDPIIEKRVREYIVFWKKKPSIVKQINKEREIFDQNIEEKVIKILEDKGDDKEFFGREIFYRQTDDTPDDKITLDFDPPFAIVNFQNRNDLRKFVHDPKASFDGRIENKFIMGIDHLILICSDEPEETLNHEKQHYIDNVLLELFNNWQLPSTEKSLSKNRSFLELKDELIAFLNGGNIAPSEIPRNLSTSYRRKFAKADFKKDEIIGIFQEQADAFKKAEEIFDNVKYYPVLAYHLIDVRFNKIPRRVNEVCRFYKERTRKFQESSKDLDNLKIPALTIKPDTVFASTLAAEEKKMRIAGGKIEALKKGTTLKDEVFLSVKSSNAFAEEYRQYFEDAIGLTKKLNKTCHCSRFEKGLNNEDTIRMILRSWVDILASFEQRVVDGMYLEIVKDRPDVKIEMQKLSKLFSEKIAAKGKIKNISGKVDLELGQGTITVYAEIESRGFEADFKINASDLARNEARNILFDEQYQKYPKKSRRG